ncbi:MAG: hypothetical protein Ct9H300mP14_16330 [Gammaproteobacteria bacterium]|nr:MAG: hypothetical protein Ct9H300mP14_16330 [Gammaproteobacteria bacterium]
MTTTVDDLMALHDKLDFSYTPRPSLMWWTYPGVKLSLISAFIERIASIAPKSRYLRYIKGLSVF